MGYRNKLPRHPSDDYQTQPEIATGIVARIAQIIEPPKVIIEPSAGVGSFVSAARKQWPNARIIAVEVREECQEPCLQAGADEFVFEDWESELNLPTPDLILGNPPFNRAHEHILKSLQRLSERGMLSFLLRMGFMNSQKRVRELWDTQPGFRYLLPFAKRPSFLAEGGHENSEYASFIFEKGFKDLPQILPHLWW